MRTIGFTVTFMAAIGVAPASAAPAPIFPGDSNIGLVPPPGMEASGEINGFQKGDATIVITEMEAKAYQADDAYKKLLGGQMKHPVVRELPVAGARAYMVKGVIEPIAMREWTVVVGFPEETAFIGVSVPRGDKTVSDAAIEKALRTIVVRKAPELPAAAVAALPFAIGDMQGFRPVRVVGATLTLSQGPAVGVKTFAQLRVFVVAIAGPQPGTDLAAFAKAAFLGTSTGATLLDQTNYKVGAVEWSRIDALDTDLKSHAPDYITDLFRLTPKGALRVRGEMPGNARDPALQARVGALAQSVALKAR